MESHESLRFSSSFVTSCGTVTLDTKASKVLVIFLRDKQEFLLPKGRVNIGENWRDAAVRETLEETGVRVQLLPTTLETRATSATQLTMKDVVPHTEPFAKTQRLVKGGVEKTLYWFAATADSTVPHVKEEAPQPGEECFETRWLAYDEALTRMTFSKERDMVRALIDCTRSSNNP